MKILISAIFSILSAIAFTPAFAYYAMGDRDGTSTSTLIVAFLITLTALCAYTRSIKSAISRSLIAFGTIVFTMPFPMYLMTQRMLENNLGSPREIGFITINGGFITSSILMILSMVLSVLIGPICIIIGIVLKNGK